MKKTTLFILIGAIFLAMSLAGWFYLQKKAMDKNGTIVVKKENSGQKIKVQTGDIVQIELEGAGSTGYWWYADNLDASFLEKLSEETKSIATDKVGAPVIGVWRFRVLQKGSTEIRMDYFRVWEGKGQAIDHFSIRLDSE